MPLDSSLEQGAAAGTMPINIQRRLQALQNLQIETYQIDVEFHKAVYELDREYQNKHKNVFRKRQAIVSGDHEPTNEECSMNECINLLHGLKLPSLSDNNELDADKLEGIPNFWLTVLKSDTILSRLVYEQDEHALTYLSDVRVHSRPPPTYSFVIEFHFRPNDYFSNTVLTKEYLLQCGVDPEDPFDFDGPEIYKAIGCEINWKPGMDLTEYSSGAACHTESIFNFFNPSDMVPDTDVAAELINSMTTMDFEVGLYLKEKVIPSAILFYLEDKATALECEEMPESFSDEEDDLDIRIKLESN